VRPKPASMLTKRFDPTSAPPEFGQLTFDQLRRFLDGVQIIDSLDVLGALNVIASEMVKLVFRHPESPRRPARPYMYGGFKAKSLICVWKSPCREKRGWGPWLRPPLPVRPTQPNWP
jgi:hypothetical protein